jgi:hypothetical protein
MPPPTQQQRQLDCTAARSGRQLILAVSGLLAVLLLASAALPSTASGARGTPAGVGRRVQLHQLRVEVRPVALGGALGQALSHTI